MDFAKVMNTIDFIGKKSQSVRELLTLLQEVSEHADQVLIVQGGRVKVLRGRAEIRAHLFETIGATTGVNTQEKPNP